MTTACRYCHGITRTMVKRTRSRGWAMIFAEEIERSARVTRKILTR